MHREFGHPVAESVSKEDKLCLKDFSARHRKLAKVLGNIPTRRLQSMGVCPRIPEKHFDPEVEEEGEHPPARRPEVDGFRKPF
jgi:hypothetical protein